MSVRSPAHRSLRSRRNRCVSLLPEVLENRVVLSTSSDPVIGTASVLMNQTYEVDQTPGTDASSLPPGPQGTSSPDSGSADSFLYTPQQIRTAYGVSGISFDGTTGDGTGQTIAIIDGFDDPGLVDSTAPNFSSSDLAQFDKAFGLPNPPSFTKYNQYGQTTNLPGTGPNSPGPSSYQIEEALDVEWAHVIAPGASIDLIECSTNSTPAYYTGAMTAATLPGVSVVSMSFTAAEWNGETAYDDDFTTPSGHQGVTFLASTGDYGSPAGYPALSPNVVAVGGTSLYLNPDNSYNDETGWSKGSDSWSPNSAGAGGISEYEPVPAYQAAVDPTTQPIAGRAAPDVSIDADPATGVAVYDSYDFGTSTPWIGQGGTSLAAPMWAGLIAIANQGRALQNEPTLNSSTDPTQTLSALYSLPPTDFHQITVGNNGGYGARPGYNEVTGLGSPVANLLVPDLAAYGLASQLVVTAQPPPVVAVGQPFDVQISAEDSFGNVDYSYDSDVTLSGPALNGSSVTVSAVNGVVTFAGVSVTAGGDDLLGTSGDLDDVNSNVIDSNGSTPVGYTPQQISAAYGINQITFGSTSGTGTGQTIAIIDPYDDPNIASDVAEFDQLFDLPSINLTVVNQQGASSPLPATDPTGDAEYEEALDVEWTHAIAPGANIVLVECDTDADSDLFAGASTAAGLSGVSVVLMSMSGDEFSGETSYDSIFTTPSGHQGVTFVASAGQYGTVTYPAVSPNVVAVGGTSLFINADDSYDGETAWSLTNGGPSQYEAEPSYQEGVQSTGQRTIPDVAFDADTNTGVTIYNSYDNASAPVCIDGYTDFASTAWAALIAIANQGRVAEGGTTLNSGNTGANPQQTQTALYSLPYTDYHDVTTGGNGDFNAGPGYDAVTGLGTPIANLLVPDLAAYGNATQLVVTQQPFSTIVAGNPFTLIVTAEDADGHVDSSYDGTVTLTLPAGDGTVTATAINGVARFTFLKVNSPGSGDTILATANGLTGTTSDSFNVVESGSTSTNLASSLNPSTYGQSLTFTATVSDANGIVPTGSVEFYDGSTDLGSGSVLSGSGNSATSTFTISTLPAGSQSISAVYTPAGEFAGSSGSLSQTVNQAILTVSGVTAANLVYDANTAATLNTSGATLVGVISGDTVTLDTYGATGTFASQNVGTGINVTVAGLTISGPQASDYTITQPTTTANITPAGLTVSGITASNKVYDANTTAALITSAATLVGVFSGDIVNLNTGGASGTFASQNAGTGITVTVAGLTISGAQASNYTLTQPTTTATITPAVLTVSGITASDKVYDSSTAATLNSTNATLVGVITGDMVNLDTSGSIGTFASKDVDTGITVTVAGLTINGAQASDYTLTQPATMANITPATLTVSDISAENKVYDASTTATLNASGAILAGLFSGDTVSLDTSGAVGTFASKDVGTAIAVTVAGLTISGPQASDYTLTQPATSANITPATLTVSGITAANKVYDASTATTLSTSGAMLVGVFSGDTVDLNTAARLVPSPPRTWASISRWLVAGPTISGAQASDYTLAQPTTTASITPAELTVSGITAANKVYNASTTAVLDTDGATLVGVFSGDTVILNAGRANGRFSSQNVGTAITVTAAGLTISGAQAGDYTLTQPTTTANITSAGLTVSGMTAANKVYDANTTASLNTANATLVGLYSGDTVSLNVSAASGTFASQYVGDHITVAVAGLTISGTQASDYTLTQPTTNANITPATLTVSGITAASKIYNGSTAAAINTSGATLVGVISGDTVDLNSDSAAGTFASQNVGNGITVNVAGLTISGAQASDYTLAPPTTTANITPAAPTVSVSVSSGTYNSSAFNANASVTGVSGQPGSELEGIAATPVYYAGSSATGTPLSGALIDAGTYTVIARFPGSEDYTANQSAPVIFTIGKGTPTVSLVSSGGSAVFGQAVTLVATVTAPGGGPTTGTVTFSGGGSPLGTVALAGSGMATLTTSTLAIGAQSITAAYSGDTDLQGGNSAASVVIARDGTEIMLVPQPVFKKRKLVSVGLDAVIEPLTPGAGLPTGQVTFELQSKRKKKVTEKVLGTAMVSGGSATLTVKSNIVLNKTINILYAGDTDFTSSNLTPPVLTQPRLKNLARPMMALRQLSRPERGPEFV